MSVKRLVVCLVIVAACKGGDKQKAPAKQQPDVPQVPLVEALPAGFPLPESPTRKLVRSHASITMSAWGYEYSDLDAKTAAKKIEDGMKAAGYAITSSEPLTATHGGRAYVVDVTAQQASTLVAIRSFPEAGPTTLPTPSQYPTAFPFVAGGTASNAPVDGKLQIAYMLDARDLELAVAMAAQKAGWQCSGTKAVTCSKDTTKVTYTTEAAPKGSLLVVSGL